MFHLSLSNDIAAVTIKGSGTKIPRVNGITRLAAVIIPYDFRDSKRCGDSANLDVARYTRNILVLHYVVVLVI